MERINDGAILNLVQQANSFFVHFFEQFSGEPLIGDEELCALLQVHQMLDSVGALLYGRPHSTASREVLDTLSCYQENLIRLRRELAIMQECTIARRACLDSERDHLDGAKAWCAVSRAIS